MSAALLERGRALRSPRPPLPPSPPPDYLAPFLPPSQSALASLSLSASLLFSPSPSHLLTSSYLQQRRRHYSPSAWSSLLSSLSSTTTLYVGNLAFTTREETVHHLFSLCGRIQSLYMGLNAQTHVPCGFCFIRFHTAEAAQRARWMINGMKVDGRVCGVDFDQEFREGRQWGRGKTGGQIRDDHRSSYDEGRGGWGTRERLKQQMRRMQEQQVTQFESISEGGKKATDEEDDSGGGGGAQLQQQKREKGSYKQANAMRKAVAGTTTVGAAVASMKREGMEATMNEEPTSKRRRVGEAEPNGEAMEFHRAEGESAAEPWPPVPDGEMQETDAGGETGDERPAAGEEGAGEAWTDRDNVPLLASANRPVGIGVRGAAAAEEEEEVEHGFAAPDEETADPTWS